MFFKKTPEKQSSHKSRNVLFWRNNYYHFYYLARALRKRGWDALLVSPEPEDGPFAKYYHGQDLTLYDEDPKVLRKLVDNFLVEAKKRFNLLHFSGDGYLCFSPHDWKKDPCRDITAWRKAGNKIAYTIGGCNSATSKSAVTRWSALGGSIVCDHCPWQNNTKICNDKKNLAWGKKVSSYCDMIFAETLPALDYIAMPERVYREPVSMCLDSEYWNPALTIPANFKIDNPENELLIYHAMGNYNERNHGGRNIKGTPAITRAVERLKAEGHHLRLIFVTGMKNSEVRFIQAQADIIVDQLHYGRFGATAREGMMLGKPVICYINQNEFSQQDKLASLQDIPLISATENNIYDMLKDLILDKHKRLEIARLSRLYALKWFDADSCAERYEQIYDSFMQRETPVCYSTRSEFKKIKQWHANFID